MLKRRNLKYMLLLITAMAYTSYLSAQTICIDVNNKPVSGRTIYFCSGSNAPTVKAKLCVPVSGTLQYLWTYLNESFVKYRTAQFIPIDTGRWEIRIKLPTGVELKDTFLIRYNTKPNFKITPKPAIKCEGMPLKLSATKSMQFQDYAWSSADAPQQILSRVDSFAYAQAGITYIVNATDRNTGCKIGDTVEVYTKQLTAPKLQLGPPDTTLCQGASVVLKNLLSDQGTHVWSNASSETSIKVTTSGKYSLTVINIFGCKAQDSINVSILPNPDIVVKNDFYACYGTGVKIGVDLSSGNPDLYQYLWIGNSFIDNPNIKNPTVKPIANTAYKVKVFSLGGCSDTATVRVFANIKITVSPLAVDTVVCAGKMVMLTGKASGGAAPQPPGNYGFKWTGPEAIQNPANITVNINPQTTGWYALRATDAKGCIGADSIRIRVTGLQANLPATLPALCDYDSLLLKPSLSGGATPYVYVWRVINASIKDSSANEIWIHPLNEGKVDVQLSVKDRLGCHSIVSTIFNSFNRPVLTSMVDSKKLCVGDSVKINVASSGGGGFNYTYEWTPLTAAVINGKTSNTTFLALNSDIGERTYRLKVKDGNGCYSKPDSLKIEVVPGFVVSLGSKDTAICGLQPLQLASTNLFNKRLQFNWTKNNQNVSTDSILKVSDAGIYQLSAFDRQSGCRGLATKTVKVDTIPVISSIAWPDTICNNAAIHITAKVSGNPEKIDWSTTGKGALDSASGTDIKYHPRKEDNDLVQFNFKAINKCGVTDTIFKLRIYPAPMLNVSVAGDTLYTDSLIVFTGDGMYVEKTIWHFSDGLLKDTGKLVKHIFKKEAKYNVIARAQSDQGCFTTDTMTVNIIDAMKSFELFIPTVFFPSSTHPDNNALKIFGKNIASANFTFRIYNRWGDAIFTTTDISDALENGWNGNLLTTGEPQPAGVYTYTCKGEYKDGTVFTKSGSAMLLR